MGTWLIEQITKAAEIDAILRIEAASFTNPWSRQMYLAELQNKGVSFLYIARDEQRVAVGFCSCWLVLDELHINNLAVEPARRRAGVASALLNRVLGEGVAHGARRATLEVRRSNDPALRLYERFGFSTTGVRHGYYSHPVEDALVLWREELETPQPLC